MGDFDNLGHGLGRGSLRTESDIIKDAIKVPTKVGARPWFVMRTKKTFLISGGPAPFTTPSRTGGSKGGKTRQRRRPKTWDLPEERRSFPLLPTLGSTILTSAPIQQEGVHGNGAGNGYGSSGGNREGRDGTRRSTSTSMDRAFEDGSLLLSSSAGGT